MAAPALVVRDLEFRWPGSPGFCLKLPDLTLNRKSSLFLQGPSGCGKSTLLALLGGIILPDAGRVEVLETSTARLSGRQRDRFRADHIGYIFQQFNLIPYLNVLDNVTLPCQFSHSRGAKARALDGSHEASARRLLARMGLTGEVLGQKANALSVGQQQRVAAARALIGQPEVLIADEPTSALDADHQQCFLDLLQAESEAAGSSLVFVSHDARLAGRFDQSVTLVDQRVEFA